MKNYILLTISILFSTILFSQETRDPNDAIKYFYLDGTPIEMNKVFNSINDVFNEHFSEYKLIGTEFDKFEKQGDYNIIYQKFSFEPLFISGNLTKSDKKYLPKVIQSFKQKYKYKDLNIDNNSMIEYDIKKSVELKLSDSFFLKTLGKPESSYKNSDDYKIYSYKGLEKSFDLIFKDGIITDYKIFNDY